MNNNNIVSPVIPANERIRVAALQYFIRPVQTFDQFKDQVEALVETAADYKCQLVVFPEYFTAQLLTLGNVKRPIREQIRDLAAQAPRFNELMDTLARRLPSTSLPAPFPSATATAIKSITTAFSIPPKASPASRASSK